MPGSIYSHGPQGTDEQSETATSTITADGHIILPPAAPIPSTSSEVTWLNVEHVGGEAFKTECATQDSAARKAKGPASMSALPATDYGSCDNDDEEPAQYAPIKPEQTEDTATLQQQPLVCRIRARRCCGWQPSAVHFVAEEVSCLVEEDRVTRRAGRGSSNVGAWRNTRLCEA